jgi:hypothetical protein
MDERNKEKGRPKEVKKEQREKNEGKYQLTSTN